LREIPSNPYPLIEMTGEEILASGAYSVLEIDEDRAVAVWPRKGLVYVVKLKDREGINLAVLASIPAKDLKRYHPRLPCPSTCTDD